jgi:hypothetical protein
MHGINTTLAQDVRGIYRCPTNSQSARQRVCTSYVRIDNCHELCSELASCAAVPIPHQASSDDRHL